MHVAILALLVGVLAPLNSGRAVAAESPYLNGVVSETSEAGFVHPGIYVGLPKLESVRRKIALDEEPQASIFHWLSGPVNSTLVGRDPDWGVYSDAADPSLPCDPDSRQGCIMDAGYAGAEGRRHTDLSKRNMSTQINSAYTNALLYYFSGGEEEYAQNAIRMLNAYAHSFKGFTSTDANSHVGDLFAGWMAQTLVRAAEIIRYTYIPRTGEDRFDVKAFEKMLRKAFVPRLKNGTAHLNNWRTSAAEGLMNVAIFLDDRGLYNRAIRIWRDVIPTYIYLTADGTRPNSLRGDDGASLDCTWIRNLSDACKTKPKSLPGVMYHNGQNQETCRDMWHSSAGVGGIINAAETASLQGDDLYGEQRTRLMTGLSFMLQLSQNIEQNGYPDKFCAGAATYEGTGSNGEPFPNEWHATEPLSVVVAYNHYATEQGLKFATLEIPGYSDRYPGGDPVEAYIAKFRSGPRDTRGYVTAWQVLTHYGVGSGVPPSAPPFERRSPSPREASPYPDSQVEASEFHASPTAFVLGAVAILLGLIVLSTLTWQVIRRRTR